MTKLSVTLVQCHLVWQNPSANRQKIQQLLDPVNQSDLIVLPEMFSTAFSMTAQAESMQGETIQWMSRLAKDKQALIIGSLIVEEHEKKYNRLICSFPNGAIEHYDKRHLFGLIDESAHFKAGKQRLIINYKNWRICPMICYDLRFPVFSRNNQDYDVLIYVANWPETRIHHWTKLLEARAIENQSYVIGVNRVGNDDNGIFFNGQSRVIDASGLCLYEGNDIEDLPTVELDYQSLMFVRKKYPFLGDADDFTIH